jgi:putative Mg2+ transporter-C (MgtC) family protein
MPLTLTWHEIAIRLALSVVAGALIGLDRGEHGRPAGLRTTLLVCLAAAVAMIQANLLLATTGKPADSFITLDLMRLPLGILTGMGFIGAGAVLRRDGLVLGVSTAATLWFVTIIGLCFGGGQISLGIAGLFLGLIVVTGLRWLDYRMTRDQHATLSLTTDSDKPTQQEIYGTVQRAGYKIKVSSVAYIKQSRQRQFEFLLQWRISPQKLDVPPFLRELSSDPNVLTAQWKVQQLSLKVGHSESGTSSASCRYVVQLFLRMVAPASQVRALTQTLQTIMLPARLSRSCTRVELCTSGGSLLFGGMGCRGGIHCRASRRALQPLS